MLFGPPPAQHRRSKYHHHTSSRASALNCPTQQASMHVLGFHSPRKSANEPRAIVITEVSHMSISRCKRPVGRGGVHNCLDQVPSRTGT